MSELEIEIEVRYRSPVAIYKNESRVRLKIVSLFHRSLPIYDLKR